MYQPQHPRQPWLVADGATLQSSHHPPASDVGPITVGSDDHRAVEGEFACLDAPTALLGDGLQPALVRRPARLPTCFLDRIEETDVWRMRLDRPGDPPQILAKALEIGGRLDIDDDGSHRRRGRIGNPFLPYAERQQPAASNIFSRGLP